MTDTPGTLEERLRRNSGWRNERHQCVTDPNLLTEAADEIASLRARVEALSGALTKIAAFGDVRADEHLKSTGSYYMFDEPGSVEISRRALSCSRIARKR